MTLSRLSKSPRPALCRNAGKVLLLAAGVLVSGGVLATEYSLQPEYSVKFTHDDNFRLQPEIQRSLWGETYAAGVRGTAREQHWDISLDTRLEASRFNREEFDSDDQFLTLAGNYRTETQLFNLNISAIRDSIRSSSIEDTGLIVAGRSERYTVAPSWQYYFSPRAYLGASVTAETGDYDDEFSQLIGYDYGQGQVFTGYAWNEKLTFTAYVLGTRYEGDETGTVAQLIDTQSILTALGSFVQGVNFLVAPIGYATETTANGWGVGIEYQWSEQLNVSLSGGKQKTSTEYEILSDPEGGCELIVQEPKWVIVQGDVCTEPSDTSLTTWSADLTWRGERQEVEMSYEDTNRPSSGGFLQQSKQFRASWNLGLTEKQALRLTGLWIENTVDGQGSLIAQRGDRSLLSVQVGYSYRFLQHWSATLAYRYRNQDVEVFDDNAESHIGTLSINYRPERSLWSR